MKNIPLLIAERENTQQHLEESRKEKKKRKQDWPGQPPLQRLGAGKEVEEKRRDRLARETGVGAAVGDLPVL